MLRAAFVFSFCLFNNMAVWCQTSEVDSLASTQAIAFTIQNYQNTVAGNSKVFSGAEFVDPLSKKRVVGHPNFNSEDWLDGFILYKGQRYDKVSLQYNLLLNKLLIENVQSHATIELDNNSVDAFGMDGHTYVRLMNPISGEPADMFYDLLYDNEIKVLVKRYKTIKETPDQKVMTTEFLEKRKIYLYKDNQYFLISNKKSALDAFAAEKTEMKKFLSQQKINFRSNPELAIVAMSKQSLQLNGKD